MCFCFLFLSYKMSMVYLFLSIFFTFDEMSIFSKVTKCLVLICAAMVLAISERICFCFCSIFRTLVHNNQADALFT